jgi:hypothetical protein
MWAAQRADNQEQESDRSLFGMTTRGETRYAA